MRYIKSLSTAARQRSAVADQRGHAADWLPRPAVPPDVPAVRETRKPWGNADPATPH